MILGGEELLVERAVAEILRAARACAGTDDVPVDHLRAGDVSTNELAELLSPSLFADERVVVLDAADEAGKDAVALIDSAAADLPRDEGGKQKRSENFPSHRPTIRLRPDLGKYGSHAAWTRQRLRA